MAAFLSREEESKRGAAGLGGGQPSGSRKSLMRCKAALVACLERERGVRDDSLLSSW